MAFDNKMKFLASLPSLCETEPIVAFSHGYLAVVVRSTVLIYSQNKKSFSFLSSFEVKNPPTDLCFITTPYSKRVLLAAASKSNFTIFDVNNFDIFSSEKSFSKIIMDDYSKDSFLAIENDKDFVKYSLLKSELTLDFVFGLKNEQPMKIVASRDNRNIVAVLTKSNDVMIMKRKNPKFPFQVFSHIVTLSDDEAVEDITSLTNGFICAWSKHFIHIIHTGTGHSFCILSYEKEKIIRKVVENDDEETVSFFVLFDDNSVEFYDIENGALKKPNLAFIKENLVFTPLECYKGKFFLITNDFSLYYVMYDKENGTLVYNSHGAIPVMKEDSPVAIDFEQAAFIDLYGFISAFRIKTGEVFMKHVANPQQMMWVDQCTLAYLDDGDIVTLLCDENDFLINKIDLFNGEKATSFTTVGGCIVARSGDTIAVRNKEGIVASKTITDLGTYSAFTDANDSLVVILTIDGKGLFFADSNLSPVFGSFPQASRLFSYKHVAADYPIVYAFDSSGRVLCFDLSSGSCCGHLAASLPQNVIPMKGDRSAVAATNGDLVIFTSKPDVGKIISDAGDLVVATTTSVVYMKTKSSISVITLRPPSKGLYEMNLLQGKEPVFLSLEASEAKIKKVLDVLSVAVDPPDFFDDINVILGGKSRKGTPAACKDIKRLYHRHVLSFAGKEMNPDSIMQMCEFIAKFNAVGDNLSAAVVSYIINEKEKCLDFLLEAGLFDVAVVFAKKIGFEEYETKIGNKFISHSLQSGDIVSAFIALTKMNKLHRAASLLYENEFHATLLEFNKKYPVKDITQSKDDIFVVDINVIREFVDKDEHIETLVCLQ